MRRAFSLSSTAGSGSCERSGVKTPIFMRNRVQGAESRVQRSGHGPANRYKEAPRTTKMGRMDPLQVRQGPARWDEVSLGEVMLRLDPGEGRIHTARSFSVWEGGGEYNVARGLRRCFGLRTAVITALADNPVGRLVEDLMLHGGVDTSLLLWVPYDGVGRAVRNGLNFTERGFGVRAAAGCSDRGHTAVAHTTRETWNWEEVFGPANGARWFHTGGIFAALSESTPGVAEAAMDAARKFGTPISYDLNFRD